MNDGIAFEVTVERWLRKRRGARFTERRARQRGRVAERGHECDVHATFGRDAWILLAIMTGLCGLACVVCGVSNETNGAIVSGILGILGLVLTTAIVLDPRHVWVECKSGEASVTREMVWKLVMQVEDVRDMRGEGGGWYPHEAWLVSRSHIDIDALAFAHNKGVRCFVQLGGDIREVL